MEHWQACKVMNADATVAQKIAEKTEENAVVFALGKHKTMEQGLESSRSVTIVPVPFDITEQILQDWIL